ncbi:MAG: precorrin-3B C(17)-methyltransferase [Rhodospirillales bacterium]|jgi:cobalt-precorrin 5A hydrolase/precorrin-3B C17-methyltransferase
MKPVLFCLTQAGADLARKLDGELHGFRPRVADTDIAFDDATAHLAALFAAGRSIVGFCAAGILVRAVAPLLDDKRSEPPVVAVSADGKFAIPLLGGHRGANRLAQDVAAALGGQAAVTTAGDVALGVSLDEPPPGWRIANIDAVKPVAAALLAGESVRIEGTAPWLDTLPQSETAQTTIRVTAHKQAADSKALIYHPPLLAVGVGCERGTSQAEIETLIATTLDEAGLAAAAVACLVSIDVKSDELGLLAVAEKFGVPARFFDAATLSAQEPRVTAPSDYVRATVGTASVAEASALAAVGSTGTLLVPKRKSIRATCAVAVSPVPLDAAKIGRARGHLDIVGIGPGSDAWRTPEASEALAAADCVVGYGLYLDLVADLIDGKQRFETGLGHETGRVERALDLAAEGRRVALVCSGDAGIYALATLAFERLEAGAAERRRIAVRVCPGISALQAAAARLGAPLGHDFCAISLSDLLTPTATIEQRLRAAADGDFVVALYNPASERRRSLLPLARDIFKAARGADCLVACARNLGRDGEKVSIFRLGDDWVESVDMLTLVMIGSTATRAFAMGGQQRLYTPRGYAAKETP